MNNTLAQENTSNRAMPQYPELTALARQIADDTCIKINEQAPRIESGMPYKEKYVLEELITILEDKV